MHLSPLPIKIQMTYFWYPIDDVDSKGGKNCKVIPERFFIQIDSVPSSNIPSLCEIERIIP